MRPKALAATALAATICVAAGAAPAIAHPPARQRLSNETTFTRWAGATLPAKVYAQPTTRSRRVGHLRYLTEDGFPEVYVLLAERSDAAGVTWVQLRLPQRPNNVTGWVRRPALGPFHLIHTRLVVDRSALRITLFERGARRFRARIGVGAPGTPTPAGHFWIREKFHVGGDSLYGTALLIK